MKHIETRHGRAASAIVCACAAATLAWATQLQAQNVYREGSDTPERFSSVTEAFDHTLREEMIPMRDGVRLHTIIVIPKAVTEPMPIVLTRTPYNANRRISRGASPRLAMRLHPPDEFLARAGYIRVFQDVRGRHGSEGQYIMTLPPRGPLNSGAVDHTTDTWDTIEWLVRNVPGNNGRVGMIGTSYDGWLTLLPLLEPHPALQAVVPMNAQVDVWMGDDWYHNGAFRQTMFGPIYGMITGQSLPLGYNDQYAAYLAAGSAGEMGRKYNAQDLPAWKRLIDNPAYTSFWREQAVDLLLRKSSVRRVPVLSVHGLFDTADIYGPIASYAALEEKDPRNDANYLVIGPWSHGQQDAWFHSREGSSLGPFKWRSDTTYHFLTRIVQPFFDARLRGKRPAQALAPVVAFETGANEWRSYRSWPPREAAVRRLYVHDRGGLSFTAPTADASAYSQYVSDPNKPVPYRAVPILANDQAAGQWLIEDQRVYSTRPDVLTFISEPLTERVEVAGGVTATLTASTTGTDADWVVKLIDVYPDEYPSQPELGGYQLMVSGEIMRGRYRESFERGQPITANEPLAYTVRMPHVHHSFEPGHRIMVQVQSSWFPLYDRNPQTFVENIAWAKPDAYQAATQRIYHTAGRESYIELLVTGTQTQKNKQPVQKTNASQRQLVTNAIVVDGTGAPARRAAVRIERDRIVAVGDLRAQSGESVIDARGLVLAPGFIDTHSHHDRGLSEEPAALAAVSQGITTIIVGQDGYSTLPLKDFARSIESHPAAVNVASYVGHGAIRAQVMGDDFKRPARPQEIEAMRAIVRTEMQAGALGLSTGLEYDPGIYSTKEEVIALARVAAAHNGRYSSHMRSEDRNVWQALEEVIDIGRATGMPVHVSHMKLAMVDWWGQAGRFVKMMDAARAAGVQISGDVYPYEYWQSGLTVLFPDRDFDNYESAQFALRSLAPASGLRLSSFAPDPSLVGRTVAEIAAMRGTDDPTTLMALIREHEGAGVIGTSMNAEDIATLIAWAHANICTDGALGDRHPRGAGAMTRVLRQYVREQKLLTLEQAVHKMSALAASHAGIVDRGVIKPGAYADLVLFDPATVADRATLQKPDALSVGIDRVWVNGRTVFDHGRATGERSGRMIRRAASGQRRQVAR